MWIGMSRKMQHEKQNGAEGIKMRRIIIRNAIRCKNCGNVIESTYRHEFVTCSCGKVSVDGGHDYLRRCSETPDGYIELCETAAPEDETDRGK